MQYDTGGKLRLKRMSAYARVICVAAKYALIEGTFTGRVEDLPREVASKGDVPVRE